MEPKRSRSWARRSSEIAILARHCQPALCFWRSASTAAFSAGVMFSTRRFSLRKAFKCSAGVLGLGDGLEVVGGAVMCAVLRFQALVASPLLAGQHLCFVWVG